ncbi:MAG: hypothetical protein KGK08_13265 [Acidobacteriota bacterium]|nr:hypothetical protein [Acidobacteriota bacterium]
MRKRTRYSLLLMLALIVALAVALVLRKHAPPEVARLLPESDAIVYANLKPLRLATHFDRTAVVRSPEYQHFIDVTGIVPERDLDAVALALHRMDDPNGPNGPVAYSEVLSGRFDGDRLSDYLRSVATGRESYAGHTIYTIPITDPSNGATRPLRVAQLGYDTVAASNMPTTEQIHSILDRYRAAASPFAGSSLLSARYGDVPLLSSAWGIGHIGLPFSERGHISVFGLELPLAEDTTFVASLQYRGSIRLRIEELAPSVDDAERTADSLTALAGIFRTMEHVHSPTDEALADALNSLKIQQHGDRAVLTADIPAAILRQLASSTASSSASSSASPATLPGTADH